MKPADLPLAPAREAYLDLRRVHERLAREFEELFKSQGLTHAWFNVLRILQGGPDEGTRCRDLGEKLVNRVPDVTRLLDRMEGAGLIERERSLEDRRVVRARITPEGRGKLRALEKPVDDLHLAQFAHLEADELERFGATLRRLLEA